MPYSPTQPSEPNSNRGTVALLCDFYSDYQKQLSNPLRRLLNDAGYGLSVVLGRPIENEYYLNGVCCGTNIVYDIIQDADIQGIIVVTPSIMGELSASNMADFLSRFGDVPTVCLGNRVPGFNSLVLDNKQGMVECMNHLIAAPENKNFMFIGGTQNNEDSAEREAIFRKSLSDAGKQINDDLVIYCDYLAATAFRAVTEMLPQHPEVDVIVCANDDSASGAIHALQSLNISVPNDIRVSGFDNTTEALSARPTMSSVTQPFTEFARLATEIIVNEINGNEQVRTFSHQSIVTEFIARESTVSQNERHRLNKLNKNRAEQSIDSLVSSLINNIHQPRMDTSIEQEALEQALSSAAAGHVFEFEQCVDTLRSYSDLSVCDIHWWQNLVAAIEDRANEIPDSTAKKKLHATLAEQVDCIERTIKGWELGQEFHKNRCMHINSVMLVSLNDAKTVDAIVSGILIWLQSLGVQRCFFTLYNEASDKPSDYSQLRLCYLNGEDVLEYKNTQFKTTDILPNELQHCLQEELLVWLPIHFGNMHFGSMLIDTTGVEYFDFALRSVVDRIGGAFRHMQQLDHLQKHADDLGAVNKKLFALANYDELTNLPNRAYFKDRLGDLLVRAKGNETQLALLFLDLDGFKFINDSLGHSAGDMLLRVVADRLNSLLGGECLVSRLGGDEFTIVVESDNNIVERFKELSAQLLEVLAEPYALPQNVVNISVSIGASLFPEHGDDIETLVRKADSAMYHAKDSGKNCFRIYTPEIDHELAWHIEQDANIRYGYENDEFHLVYQPKYSLKDMSIVGAEALLRWSPKNQAVKAIGPDLFIPVAEQTGFVTQLDLFTLNTACASIKRWDINGMGLPVAVNVSALQLHKPEFVDIVASSIREHGIRPELLELEVTESAAMQDVELSIVQLTRLTELGVSISLDDFGTGHSSLSYLKRLPISTVKIDRSFLLEIGESCRDDDPDVAIVRAIVALGLTMKYKVIAEGIEHREQQELLAEIGCHVGQGFYFSKPISEEKYTEILYGEFADKAA